MKKYSHDFKARKSKSLTKKRNLGWHQTFWQQHRKQEKSSVFNETGGKIVWEKLPSLTAELSLGVLLYI